MERKNGEKKREIEREKESKRERECLRNFRVLVFTIEAFS